MASCVSRKPNTLSICVMMILASAGSTESPLEASMTAHLAQVGERDNSHHAARVKPEKVSLEGNVPDTAREQADFALIFTPGSTEAPILKERSPAGGKQYKDAIDELKKAIAADPNKIQPYIDLARVYVSANDRESAEKTLNHGLTANPRSTELLTALGDFRVLTGKLDQAETIFKQILDIEPANESGHLRLSDLYLRLKRPADAEDMLRKLAALNPQDEKPQLLLGDFFTLLGQLDKALTSYQQAAQIQPDSTIARNKLISHYLDTGKLAEAESRIRDLLAKNAKDLMGRFFNARLLLAKQDPNGAISLLQSMIKDEPQFAAAYHFLGVAHLQNHDQTQARASFVDAVKHNPRLIESRTALAQLYLAEGSAELALEQAQTAIQLNPRNVQAALVAGTAYLKKGDIVKSRQVFEAITQAMPKEPMGPYQLGLVSRMEKNDAKALAYFEEALKRRPTAIEPIIQIASIKLAQGKSEDARKRVVQQLEQAPQSPLLHNLLGQLWTTANDYTRAEQEYRKAIDLDNSLFQAYLNLAGIYLRMGKQDQAINEYEAVLAKNPNAIQAHMMLGVIHDIRKEFDKAQARYETILKLNPRFVPAANNLAWILAEQGGNLDVALAYAQTAREGNPEDPYIADTLGWIYYKKNAPLLAVNLLKEAVDKLPNRAEVHYHYGMAQAKNNNPSEAKKALQTAIKLNANFDGANEARKTLEGL